MIHSGKFHTIISRTTHDKDILSFAERMETVHCRIVSVSFSIWNTQMNSDVELRIATTYLPAKQTAPRAPSADQGRTLPRS
jgi:hypothetical protein